MELTFFDKAGKKSGVNVHDDLFSTKVNKSTLAKSIYVIASNARSPIAKTLTKSTVRGGGRKPFKQKGTGHARQGSIRNPHYKGGGVAFGATGLENYKKDMPLKEKRLALFGALSFAADKGHVCIVDFGGDVSTSKEAMKYFGYLPAFQTATLYVAHEENVRGIQNFPSVEIVNISNINARDILSSKMIFITKGALENLEKSYIS